MKGKKVRCTLVQALRLCAGRTARRESGAIALLFLDHGTRRGEGSASRPGHSLPPGKTRYPLYRRLGGPQDRSVQEGKISPPPGFDPRTVKPAASRYTDYATRPTTVLIPLSKSEACFDYKWSDSRIAMSSGKHIVFLTFRRTVSPSPSGTASLCR